MKSIQAVAVLGLVAGCAQAFVAPRVGLNSAVQPTQARCVRNPPSFTYVCMMRPAGDSSCMNFL